MLANTALKMRVLAIQRILVPSGRSLFIKGEIGGGNAEG